VAYVNIQLLRYFQQTAKYEHITKTAQSLFVTQPALSLAIKNLEDELGVSLFDRHGRSIRLSKCGRILLEHVNVILGEMDAAIREIKELEQNKDDKVVIASPSSVLQLELVNSIYSINPNITIDFVSIFAEGVEQRFLAGEIDMWISSPPVTGKGIKSTPLIEENLGVVTSVKHPIAHLKEVPLAALKGEKFAAYPKNTAPRKAFESFCRESGFVPQVVFEGNSIRDMFKMVQANRAIGCAALWALRMNKPQLEGMTVIPLAEKKYSTLLGLSWHSDHPERKVSALVRDTIIDFYTDSAEPY
jgi:DNA-binding transcriptional LysR family regulator